MKVYIRRSLKSGEYSHVLTKFLNKYYCPIEKIENLSLTIRSTKTYFPVRCNRKYVFVVPLGCRSIVPIVFFLANESQS